MKAALAPKALHILFVVLLATGSGVAFGEEGLSSNPDIRKAQIAVYQEGRTREGKDYDARIAKEFQPRYTSVVHSCAAAAKPEDKKTFTLYTQFEANGRVKTVVLDPANTLTQCIQKILAKDAFSPPPRPDYWVQITIQLTH